MNRQNNDNNTEAVKIANALKPFAKKWFDEWGQSCLRSKKMTVSTKPNGTVIGVKDAFSDTEVFVKYMAECSSAKVGDTVWCKWMYDNMQTLYADSMGDISKKNVEFDNVTVDGALDVTPRRCYASLSSAGWYRVMTITSDGRGGWGFAIDFNITRAYDNGNNEVHAVKLLGIWDNFAFTDEVSKTNYHEITKIRYTKDSSNNGYIDIYYGWTGSGSNNVAVDIAVHTNATRQQNFTANSLEAVADAPSGETVVTTYSFASNGTVIKNGIIDASQFSFGQFSSFQDFYINGNSSINITLPSPRKALIMMGGANSASKELIIANSTAAGVVTYYAFHNDGYYTFATSTNTLTITDGAFYVEGFVIIF